MLEKSTLAYTDSKMNILKERPLPKCTINIKFTSQENKEHYLQNVLQLNTKNTINPQHIMNYKALGKAKTLLAHKISININSHTALFTILST